MKRLALVVPAFVAAAAISACGSGSTTTVTETQSKAVSDAASTSGISSGPTVPSGLVGEVLDQAETTLTSDGISYTTSGGNVILRSDWGVCSTTPAAGQPVDGAVVLNLGHFSCGASN